MIPVGETIHFSKVSCPKRKRWMCLTEVQKKLFHPRKDVCLTLSRVICTFGSRVRVYYYECRHYPVVLPQMETSEVIEEYNRMNLDGSNKTTRIECIDDDCNKECTFVDFGSHDKNEFGQVADLSPVLLDGIEEISEERLAAFTHIFFNRPTDSKMLFSPIEGYYFEACLVFHNNKFF
ncbi:hypothetical protein RB195_010232 [Necator americanus]|uniref:Uncharacterized protein n=1 Tax=Necator americanus TaxID=51031 RepID=A0ABR1CX12_NECAM